MVLNGLLGNRFFGDAVRFVHLMLNLVGDFSYASRITRFGQLFDGYIKDVAGCYVRLW